MIEKAEDDIKYRLLERDTFKEILGDQVHVVTFGNLKKWAFEKKALLSKLNPMKISICKAGDIVLKKGDKAKQKIIFIIEGSFKESKSGISVWGEDFLQTNKTKTFDEDIVMQTNGVIGEIQTDNFIDCVRGELEEIIKKNQEMLENIEKSDKAKWKEAQSLKKSELLYIKTIAYGQFGPVYLVKAKHNSQPQVLKVWKKSQVHEQNFQKKLLLEKEILENKKILNFPFIISLMKTFKDSLNIYYLQEYVKGMRLSEVIKEFGLLSTNHSQFYVASMILIAECLYLQNIVHREIKPENFIVDSKGFLKLIDLGIAKIIKRKQGIFRTYTMIGTPHYMAPEIILGMGYNHLADVWSIGICLYEFMCGMVPFGAEAEDPYEIYKEIMKNFHTYQNYLKDEKAKKLMDSLLSLVPDVRLPGGSYLSLKKNAWFENFDWDKLLEKEIKSPYIPSVDKLLPEIDKKSLEQNGRMIEDEIQQEQSIRESEINSQGDYYWDAYF